MANNWGFVEPDPGDSNKESIINTLIDDLLHCLFSSLSP